MSYLDNLSAQSVMETLGLRRAEPGVVDLVVPVLAAFGVGMLVGAGVGLLLAPQSGKDTRDDIADRAGKLADQARHIGEDVRARLPGGDVMDGVGRRPDAPAMTAKPRPANRTLGET